MKDKILQRGKIGNVELKNRMFKPAAESCYTTDTYLPDRLIDFYAEQARGGVGLVITGQFTVPKTESQGYHDKGCVINDDKYIPAFANLARTIQDNGARACCQLAHWGSHDRSLSKCVSYEALSSIEYEEWMYILFPQFFDPNVIPPHEEYTIAEIEDMVNDYGDAALRAKISGFDMVEVHAGHRHGPGCFLSPLTNRRTDKYGGSVQNRARFLYEVIENIQEKCGKDYPIIVRLNGCDDYNPKGQTIEQTIEISKKLEEMGVAALNISIQTTVGPMQTPDMYTMDLAAAVKKEVRIPVMTAGGIDDYKNAEQALRDGKIDFAGFARPLFADPDMPKKVKQRRTEEIRPCIRCCECAGDLSYGTVRCTMNPTLNNPGISITKTSRPQNVAVVGGGPAGMEAAVSCAQRGHTVTLFEKRKLGGLLNEASVPEFKAELRRIVPYFENMFKILNVTVKIEEATAKKLKDFDAIIIAAGSAKLNLKVPGADNQQVISAIDLLGQNLPTGQKVTVIGGGSVGVETALLLQSQGKEVTIVEMTDEIMKGELAQVKLVYFKWIQERNITVLTSHKLQSIQDKSVTLLAPDGSEKELETDNVIVSIGLKPERDLLEYMLDESDIPVYAAGDCLRPRKIYNAIHEGYSAAMSV
ncbi:MAG: FAD-dependent oxidoreductase [Lachnospiraceae bacterium]